jgi:ATP-binding cassette subfamily B protein
VSQAEVWPWILQRLRPYKLHGLFILLALALEVAFVTLFPIGVRLLIDNAILARNGQVLITILGGTAGLFVASTVVSVVGDRLTADVAVRVLNDIRYDLYRHLQTLSLAFFAHVESGELMSRFTNDFAALEAAIAHAMPNIFRYGLQAVVSVVLLFLLDWRLALVTLVALPLTLLGPNLLGPRAVRAGYVRKQDEGRVSATLQDALSGQLVVRAFALEPRLRDRLSEQLGTLTRSTSRTIFLSTAVGRSTNVAVTIVELLIVGVGGLLLYQGLLSTGSLVAFIGLVLNVDTAVSHLSQVFPQWLQAPGSIQRIEEILRKQPDVEDAQEAPSLPRISQSVRFAGVTFGYRPDSPSLRDVTVEIPAGRSIAIVGQSGSGKSTLLSLLARFYDPDAGSVTIDGTDLRSVSQVSLRSQMGIVFQESFLFNTTVRENIRMGRADASDQEVETAARVAEVHDAIVSLAEGYETAVGERGGRLSGGERQRVALARALLREPAILLLDEATSALDPATEAAFNATLAQVGRARTVISVTHRLATVVHADRILVMENGRLVQQGSHDQLVLGDGAYRRLWELQSGFLLTEDGQHAEVTPARLKAIPLLADVDEALLATVADRFATESFAAGKAIVEEGDPGEKFYILVRGALDVWRQDAGEGGQPGRIAVVEEGDFFGEVALLANVPRTATVRARTTSIVLSLARDQFQSLLASSPPLRKALEGVAERRRHQLLATTTAPASAGAPEASSRI